MKRLHYLDKISQAFRVHNVVALLGPRQCGKTTLSRMYAEQFQQCTHLDLEDPRDLAKLDNPMLALESLHGLIIIDEIQRRPELFPVLRVLVDKPNSQQKYLILGSASRDLIRQSSETLAGRIAHIELTPFVLSEVNDSDKLLIRGGFPRSFLANNEQDSADWRREYVRTFLERDIPNLGFQIASSSMRRFWAMLAHYNGNLFNAAEIGTSLGISHTAIRNYLGILEGTFMIRQLKPWHANIKKRQVKTAKIYFRDTGILNSLLGIDNNNELLNNPKLGSIWEGFALEQIVSCSDVQAEDCYFWRTHAGAELDLLVVKGDKRFGYEMKYADAPRITKSMRNAIDDLQLSELMIVIPGSAEFRLAQNIRVIGLEHFVF